MDYLKQGVGVAPADATDYYRKQNLERKKKSVFMR
jgi:hypothetical protein